MAEIANWEEAIRPNTTFFYLESPNSWDFALQPIAEVAALAKKHQITTLIDNSYCTPLYQRPMEMGIDMAMQTATKYIGGHSDTLGGVLSGSGAAIRKIFDSELMTLGSGIQPFNAWMLIRGLRTCLPGWKGYTTPLKGHSVSVAKTRKWNASSFHCIRPFRNMNWLSNKCWVGQGC